MSNCEDFETKLGIKIGKIKMEIPEDSHWKNLKLTLEKRTRNGANTLEFKISGTGYRDERIYETISIQWDAVDSMVAWILGGPRKPGSTKTSDNALTLKRQMQSFRLGFSQMKSAMKRMQNTFDDVEIEKENTLPEAGSRRMDF